jgi:hypothetical protein
MRSLSLKILLLIMLLCLWMPSPVAACSPTKDAAQYSLADYIANAPIIFVGEVVAGENPYGDTVIITAEVEVDNYLKGEGLAIVEISGFGYGPDCLSRVTLGQNYIFFASPNDDGSLNAVYFSAQDAVQSASIEHVTAIQGITGQFKPPSALTLDAQISRFLNRNGQWLLGVSLGVSGLAGVIALLKRRPTRKAKMKRDEIL